MTMKPALLLALGLASTFALTAAHAQTYQWKDGSGRTIISDSPPPPSARGSRTLGSSPPPASEKPKSDEAAKPADAPKTTAEKDFEFKKRQQEAREKADKEAKEKAAAAEKKDYCDRSRGNLAALESSQAISTMDEKGERKIMDNGQREQEIERLRRLLAENCK